MAEIPLTKYVWIQFQMGTVFFTLELTAANPRGQEQNFEHCKVIVLKSAYHDFKLNRQCIVFESRL